MPRPPSDAPNTATQWLRRIRYRHLEVLQAISRHGSLTAAAAALDITQPAVSQWLADIEAAAGARLFERGQRLRPTPWAAPVLAHAERVLNDARRMTDEVSALRSGGCGQVRLGVMQVAAVAWVPAVVLQLRSQGSDLELTLIEDVAAGLWARFERNELDLLVTRLDGRALSSGLPQRSLFSDRHRIICGAHHPLLGRRRPTWRDVSRYPWLMPTPGTPLRAALEASFAGAGVAVPPVLLSSVSTLANTVLLGASEALAIVSGAAAARLEAMGAARTLPLTLSQDIGDVGLVWRDAAPGPALTVVLAAFDQVRQAQDQSAQ